MVPRYMIINEYDIDTIWKKNNDDSYDCAYIMVVSIPF